MHITKIGPAIVAVVISTVGAGVCSEPPLAAGDSSNLDRAFALLPTYDWGQSREALGAIEAAVSASHNDDDVRSNLERRLMAVLQRDATTAAKGIVCRKLARVGSDASILALSRLLYDKDLSHMARHALEAIGTAEATDVLRDALLATTDKSKVGVIHSLGRMRDRQAVPLLVPLLTDPNTDVADAAVTALGKIATAEAAEALLDLLPTASNGRKLVLSAALLDVAACRVADGHLEAAAALYQRLDEGTPPQVQLAAFRGLTQSLPQERVPRILGALSADSLPLRGVAAELVRETRDAESIDRLTAAMDRLPAAGKAALLEALRGHELESVREAVLSAIEDQNADVRAEGLQTLVACGTAEDVMVLVRMASSSDNSSERELAFDCLRRLKAAGTDASLVANLPDANGPVRVAVIRGIVARRSPHAVPALLKAAERTDPTTRIEAFTALQTMATADDAEALVKLLIKTPSGKEREAADRAVRSSCLKITDVQRQADPLLAALKGADLSTRCILLPALGRIGGDDALQMIRASMKDANQAVADAAVRGLANWPNADVAEELLEIARNSINPSHRIWTLRGFARVVAQRGKDRPDETFHLLNQGMKLAERPDERKLILSRLVAVRTPESLEMALSHLETPSLADEALESSVALAEAMKASYPTEASAALERLLKVVRDTALRQRIEKLLWNMKLKED